MPLAALSKLPSLQLVACLRKNSPARTNDESPSFIPHPLRELGRFREEAITRVDSVNFVLLHDVNEGLNVHEASSRRQFDSVHCPGTVRCVAGDIHSIGFQIELSGSCYDPRCDFSPVVTSGVKVRTTMEQMARYLLATSSRLKRTGGLGGRSIIFKCFESALGVK